MSEGASGQSNSFYDKLSSLAEDVFSVGARVSESHQTARHSLRFEILQEAIEYGFFEILIDEDGSVEPFVQLTQEAQKLLGLDPATHVANETSDVGSFECLTRFFDESSSQQLKQTIAGLVSGEGRVRLELRTRSRERSFILTAARLCDGAGKPISIQCAIVDKTVKTQLFEELLATRERHARDEKFLRNVLSAVPSLISYIDPHYCYNYMNGAYERTFGIQLNDFMGQPMANLLGYKAFELVKPYIDEALKGVAQKYERTMPYKHGGTRSIEVHYLPDVDENGKVIGVYSIVGDITAMRHSIQEIQESKRRMEFCLSSVKMGVWEIQVRPRTVLMEHGVYELLGYPRRSDVDFVSLFKQIAVDQDVEKFLADLEMAIYRQRDFEAEYRAQAIDGSVRLIHCKVHVVFDKNRLPERLVGACWDVTEVREKDRQIAEAFEKLSKSEAAFKAVFENAPLGIVQLDQEFNYVRVNPYYSKWLGYTTGELLKLNVADITHPDDITSTLNRRQLMISGESRNMRQFEKRYFTKSGEEVWGSVSSRWVDYGEGIGKQFFGVIEDITDRKKLELAQKEAELKLITAAKMSSLGEMASGIAHEINNPLAIISGKAELLKMYLEKGNIDLQLFAKELAKVSDTAHRIGKIIKGLRTFSRDSQRDPMVSENLNRIVFDSLEFCRERFRNQGVEIRFQPFSNAVRDTSEEGEARINCRAPQIAQVIINLLNNAFDAVSAQPERWVEISIEAKQNAGSGERVRLMVTDSGTGIPEAIREKLMVPFFTTKEVGKGTGLGLSISHGVARDHGGELYYDSSCANTRFVLELPLQVLAQAQGQASDSARVA